MCTKTIVLGIQSDRPVPAFTAAVLLLAMLVLSRRARVEGILARHIPRWGTAPFRGAFAVVLIMGLLAIKVSVPPSYGVLMPLLLITFGTGFALSYVLPGYLFRTATVCNAAAPRPRSRPAAPSLKDLPKAGIDPAEYPWHRPVWLACQMLCGVCLVALYVNPAFLPSAGWAGLTRFAATAAGLVAAYFGVWALHETKLKKVPSLRSYTGWMVAVGLITGMTTAVLLHPLLTYSVPHIAHRLLAPAQAEASYRIADTEILEPIQRCRRHLHVSNLATPGRTQWFCADGFLEDPAKGDRLAVTGTASRFGLSVERVEVTSRATAAD